MIPTIEQEKALPPEGFFVPGHWSTFAGMEHLLRIEHIGIAVKDLASAEAVYTKLLGEGPYKREAVEREGVMTSFFRSGPNKIELLESTRPDGPIAKAIEKRGEGIHHIAFEVADIRAEMARLKGRRLHPAQRGTEAWRGQQMGVLHTPQEHQWRAAGVVPGDTGRGVVPRSAIAALLAYSALFGWRSCGLAGRCFRFC